MKAGLTALVATLLLLLSACNATSNSAGQISERIGQVANDPASRQLDLPKLTTFGWDRVHFFKAGTTRDELCRFLNAGRNVCGRVVRYEVVPAEHVALLFTLGEHLTHLELHALSNGVFDVDFNAGGLPRSACVFQVRHTAGATPGALLVPRQVSDAPPLPAAGEGPSAPSIPQAERVSGVRTLSSCSA